MVTHRSVLLAGLPVTERRLTVAGVPTMVLEGGEGPPVVLLHGGVEAGGAYWAPEIPSLAGRHRVIVPDVPGLGESDPMARLDRTTFMDWCLALLEQTCDRAPVVVAHSLLGSLAAEFAVHHGHRVRSLALYGAPGIGPYRLPLGWMFAGIMIDMQPSQQNQDRSLRWVFRDPISARGQHPEWFDAFDHYCVSHGAVAHVKRTMRQLVRIGTRRIPDVELRRIRIPTVLLWGRHDRMTPLGLAQSAATKLGWPLHVIDDAGHVPHLETPDAFLRALPSGLVDLALASGRVA